MQGGGCAIWGGRTCHLLPQLSFVERPVPRRNLVGNVVVVIGWLIRLFAQTLQSCMSGRALSRKAVQLAVRPDEEHRQRKPLFLGC